MSERRRAAKYKRISRDREGLQLGIERQDEDLDALADRRGLVWAGDYFDNDISASTKSRKRRPDYDQMLKDARDGKFAVIAAYTTGRITRRPREFEDLIDLAVEHGIEFQYVRSPEFDLATAQGRRIARTLAAQDAGEAEEIAERVARQKIQAAAAGEWRGGRRPYGYAMDGITVAPIEAAEVLRMSRAVLAGTSLRSLAAEMNKRVETLPAGFIGPPRPYMPTSTGGRWRQDTVRKVLIRARNAGLIEVGRDDGTSEVIGNAKWPAIVPATTWRGVVALLEDPKRRTQFSSVRRWMGSGLYCCYCGSVVRATTGGVRAAQPKVAYMCGAAKHVVRTAEEVDDLVSRLVVARLQQPDAVDLLTPDDQDATADLHDRALSIGAQLDELAGMYARRAVTASQLETGTADLRQELAEVDALIAEASRGSVLDEIVRSGDVPGTWARYGLDRRRAIIDHLFGVTLLRTAKGRPKGWKRGESYFDPESVQIDWKV